MIKINSPKSTFAVHRNGLKVTGPKSAIAKLRKALTRKNNYDVISFTLCPFGVQTWIHIYRSLANYTVVSNPTRTELLIYPDRKGSIVIDMEV
jgi:hypothetical protein